MINVDEGITIGTRVYHKVYGIGTVIETNYMKMFPLIVAFDGNAWRMTFTSDGRYTPEEEPTLFRKYIFQPEDIITYTCGRQRKVESNNKARAISKDLSEFVTYFKLQQQIDEGDVRTITRNNKIIYSNMKKNFPQSFKSGMRIKLRNNAIFVVAYSGTSWYIWNPSYNIITIDNYNSKGKYSKNSEFDIVAIYDPFDYATFPFDIEHANIIWEEPQIIELTLDDIAEKFNIPVELLKIKK